MKIILVVFLVLLFCLNGNAQTSGVYLTPRHAQKVGLIKSGHKRLIKYYKYNRKDSARYERKRKRHYTAVLDSTWKATRVQEKLSKKLGEDACNIPGSDSISGQFRRWYSVYKDTTSSDSLRTHAKKKLRELAIQKAKLYPGFQVAMDKYQSGADSSSWRDLAKQVPGLDSLSGVFDSSPKELFATAEKSVENYLQANYLQKGNMSVSKSELEKLTQMKDAYESYRNSMSDTDSLKTAGKDKAIKMAGDHFKDHQGELSNAQGKMNRLLGKYREFSNSADLKDAVKHTSMKGKSFVEHLLVGGNFNIISVKPVSIDMSLRAGYKFTSRLAVGAGVTHRLTFGDSIRTDRYVSPNNTSFDAFSSYDVLKSVFAYAEWKTSGVRMLDNDRKTSRWANNYFVGVGKKLLIHPKLYLTITALYNLNNDNNNPVFLKRFQVRIGFQLSELALHKKKVFYDPNR